MAGLTIGKLAAGEGVGAETVRFYQRRGLLRLPERAGSGFREYSEDDRQRLAFIRRARQLGFSLAEIGELLGAGGGRRPDGVIGGAGDGRRADDVVRAAEAKLATISEQIAELALLQDRLRRLVRVCAHGDTGNCVALRLAEPPVANGPNHVPATDGEGVAR